MYFNTLVLVLTQLTENKYGYSRGPCGLRCRSTAAWLPGSRVRIPPGAWMFVCCECCVLSGRGLCDGPITRPEESYRLWCVVVCDLEKPQEWGGHSPRLGCKRHKKNGGCYISGQISGLYISIYMYYARLKSFILSYFLPVGLWLFG